MDDDLKKPQSRALQYWLVDGVGEIFVGFFFLLVAVVYYLQGLAPGSLFSMIFSIGSVLLVLGGAFGGRWIIQRIKERTTYPRTGYVAYKSGWKNKGDVVIVIGLMAFLLAFVVFTMVTDSKLTKWGPIFGGLCTGALMAQAGYRSSATRFYVLAFLSLLIGVGLVISGLSILLGWLLFFGLNGLILLVSGGLMLWKYVRRNPQLPAESPDEQ